MSQRNSNQVSEANALRYFPSTVLEPFGYTGIPTLMRTDLHEVIDHELRELIARMNKLLVPTPLMRVFLMSKATYLGASNAKAAYIPDNSECGKEDWIPSHYIVDYRIAGQSFSSYIDSAI
jgi:hypothetical protein